MCRGKTHADCDYAAQTLHEEWRDRWGQAHEREVIQCRLSTAPTFGSHFTASDCQPEGCGWARVMIKQLLEAD